MNSDVYAELKSIYNLKAHSLLHCPSQAKRPDDVDGGGGEDYDDNDRNDDDYDGDSDDDVTGILILNTGTALGRLQRLVRNPTAGLRRTSQGVNC